MPKSRTLLIEVSCETFPDHSDEEFMEWADCRLRAENDVILGLKYPTNPLVFNRLNAEIIAVDEEIGNIYIDQIIDEQIERNRVREEGRYGKEP